MKKAFLLLALVALVATTGTVRSAGSAKIQNATNAGAQVPEAVMNTFNGIVTDIMNTNFPSNPNYNASGVTWSKEKKDWTCSGFVSQVGGNGTGVNIISGRFLHSGEFIEVLYTVNQ